jgi:hypothetical protein
MSVSVLMMLVVESVLMMPEQVEGHTGTLTHDCSAGQQGGLLFLWC